MVKVGPLQPSGRVIAAGRLLFASLFLIAVWADSSQPTRAHAATYVLLCVFVTWSLAVALLVWNDWWRDAKLAAPAHVVDVAVFMIMLYSTEGYTSPYFIFFIFVLLTAAIRWGWKETAITAAALVGVYLTVGLTLGPAQDFEIERFIVRTGHLLIISGILIWFGANHWVASPRFGRAEEVVDPGGDAFVGALRSAMATLGARRGVLLWRETGDEAINLASVLPLGSRRSVANGFSDLPALPDNLLFDLGRDRVLARADESRWRFLRASSILPRNLAALIDHKTDGLALLVKSGTAEGLAVFQDIPALSTDHLDFAPRLARDMAAGLQSAALLAAVEERSMGKARVAVARDLHDSIVQFLAGLGYRLEALIRLPADGGVLAASLAELKDMVVTEQRQLRAFIRGLQAGKPVSVAEFIRDCASLCELLERQWGIECSFASEGGAGTVPLRTQLDVQQLIREAVANAVRHGGASRVTVTISSEKDGLRLSVTDDGKGFAQPYEAQAPAPASLSGRVREARGVIDVNSTADGTSLVIHLPLEDAA